MAREDAAELPTEPVRLDELAHAYDGDADVAVEADGATWVRGDRDALERALANLVDNARRHGPPGGRVEVECGRRRRGGMADGQRQRPRHRRRPGGSRNRALLARARRGGRRRLRAGLALVRATAERHGGSLVIDGSASRSIFPLSNRSQKARLQPNLTCQRQGAANEHSAADIHSSARDRGPGDRDRVRRDRLCRQHAQRPQAASAIAGCGHPLGPRGPAGQRCHGADCVHRPPAPDRASWCSLLTAADGATGRLWAGGGQLRLELQASTGDTEIGFDGHVPDGLRRGLQHRLHDGVAPGRWRPYYGGTSARQVPSISDIRQALQPLLQHVSLAGPVPTNIGGQPAYTVRISPKHSAGLLGSVELGWDAAHGVPLKVAVFSQGDSTPVLSLKATSISFGSVPASDLSVSMAPGAKVVHVTAPTHMPGDSDSHGKSEVSGVNAVAHALSFPLSAPAQLVGVPRRTVRLVESLSSKGAMVVYGRGLGAILVLAAAERRVGQSQHVVVAADGRRARRGCPRAFHRTWHRHPVGSGRCPLHVDRIPPGTGR